MAAAQPQVSGGQLSSILPYSGNPGVGRPGPTAPLSVTRRLAYSINCLVMNRQWPDQHPLCSCQEAQDINCIHCLGCTCDSINICQLCQHDESSEDNDSFGICDPGQQTNNDAGTQVLCHKPNSNISCPERLSESSDSSNGGSDSSSTGGSSSTS